MSPSRPRQCIIYSTLNHICRITPPPMQPLITFTFDSAKILSTTIRSREERPIEYTTTTVKGSLQHSTALEGTPGRPDALIDWKRKTFAIAGSTRDISELRTKRATFSSCEMPYPPPAALI